MNTINDLKFIGSHLFEGGEVLLSEENIYEKKIVYALLKDGLLIGDYICDYSPDGGSSWSVTNLDADNLEKLEAAVRRDYPYPNAIAYLKAEIYGKDASSRSSMDFYDYLKANVITYEQKFSF